MNSITSLGGYDINTGKGSWDTAGAAWSGLGMTAAGLLLFASPAGWAWQASAAASKAMGQDRPELLKPVDDFVNGAGKQLAGAVGGFTQWDTRRTDPGKAATNVILNVGSLAIPVGGAGAAAKALAGAKVGALVEKFIDVGSKIRGPAGEVISDGVRAGANGVGDALKVLEAARQQRPFGRASSMSRRNSTSRGLPSCLTPRASISSPRAGGWKMPSGNEVGANDLWMPHGKLPGGFSEAVIDAKNPQPDQYEVSKITTKEEHAHDKFVSRADRYSLGTYEHSGLHYASIPVTTGVANYEEYYEIDEATYLVFRGDPERAVAFVEECRRRQHDDLLLQKSGWNRGTPWS